MCLYIHTLSYTHTIIPFNLKYPNSEKLMGQKYHSQKYAPIV